MLLASVHFQPQEIVGMKYDSTFDVAPQVKAAICVSMIYKYGFQPILETFRK